MLSKFLNSKFGVRREYVRAFETLLLLFSCWGVLLSLNDLLSVAMRGRLHLSYRTALLLQSSYFLVSFVSAPLVGRILERQGYRRSILAGLLLMAGGCLLMAMSVTTSTWLACLGSSMVVGLGVNLMQSAAAPLVTHLGDSALGSRRFAFALGFNSLGTTVGPLLGARWLMTVEREGGQWQIALPYLALTGALLIVLWMARKLPTVRLPEERAAQAFRTQMQWRDLLHKPPLLLGAAAMFLYVGAEIGIGGLLIPFEAEAGTKAIRAAQMLSLYWSGSMLGRFLLVPWLRKPRDLAVLTSISLAAVVLLLVACEWQHAGAEWALLPVGLCNSVIVPILYDRSLEGLGALTSRGAAIMSSMGLGGVVLPQILGSVSDRAGIHHAFLLLIVPYIAIAGFAVSYARLQKIPSAL